MDLVLHYSPLPFPKPNPDLLPWWLCAAPWGKERWCCPSKVCVENPFDWWTPRWISPFGFLLFLLFLTSYLSTGPQWWDKALKSPCPWEEAGGWNLTQSWGILISYRVKIRIRALQNNFQVTLCHTLLWWAEGLAQQYENWHNWVWFKGLHVAEFMDKAAWIWLKR